MHEHLLWAKTWYDVDLCAPSTLICASRDLGVFDHSCAFGNVRSFVHILCNMISHLSVVDSQMMLQQRVGHKHTEGGSLVGVPQPYPMMLLRTHDADCNGWVCDSEWRYVDWVYFATYNSSFMMCSHVFAECHLSLRTIHNSQWAESGPEKCNIILIVGPCHHGRSSLRHICLSFAVRCWQKDISS